MAKIGWRTAAVWACLASALAGVGRAESPGFSLIPFKRIEADPKKEYALTQDNGPWMILATSFSGEGAETQARKLVLELRRDHKLPAYTHKRHYDFSQPVDGLGVNKFGETKKMRHAHAQSFDEIAVLVGNYESLDDDALQKTLLKLKYLTPVCLDLRKTKSTSQTNVHLRNLYRLVSRDEEQKTKGPMGAAFATLNPLLPEETSDVPGIDPLVLEMNRDVEYSLLKNRSKYSVKVATFGGVSTWKKDEIEKFEKSGRGKLEEAAYKANKITEALRAQGVEAWEFHDLHESIVCVGGFESVGEPREDGKIEINPQVHAVIKKYGAEQRTIPGTGVVGLHPKSLSGIKFDVQPIPVQVPRVSLAARFTRRPLGE